MRGALDKIILKTKLIESNNKAKRYLRAFHWHFCKTPRTSSNHRW